MDELIEENMGLVARIVNSFEPKNHTERQDYMDAGRIGLWKALKKYDIKSGNVISTYAWRPIRWSIIREIKNYKKHKNISLNDISDKFYSKSIDHDLWECYTNKMTEDEKQILNLRIQGYKFREICNILNQSSSSVKNKFYNLVKKLRKANCNE
ncbi:MAG: sigma-70 family RNA polymerase sigma factor [Candidatus Lokiarchaeota archaeon]|nr:sigma-70 family RNA polymerase sigma factor [Candidatus Lokiarchaeota archaeon]